MKILLDTHLLLWAAGQPRRLPKRVRTPLDDEQVEPIFSSASIREITIKRSVGRDDFQVDPRALCRNLRDNGYAELPVTAADSTIAEYDCPIELV
jgi:PIN domain nuclease of toxin-antitoxin system